MKKLTLQELTVLLSSENSSLNLSGGLIPRTAFWGILLYLLDITLVTSVFLFSSYITGLKISTHNFPILLVFAHFYPLQLFVYRLYPGFGSDVVNELRFLTRTSIVSAIIYIGLTILLSEYNALQMTLIISGISLIFLFPFFHLLIKKILAKSSYWGMPVIIIGAGDGSLELCNSLRKQKHIGLIPIVFVDDDINKWGYIGDCPIMGGIELIPSLVRKLGIKHALITLHDESQKKQVLIDYNYLFNQVISVPVLFGLTSIWMSGTNLAEILGMEEKQDIFHILSEIKKRLFDMLLSISLLFILSPVYLILALIIKFESDGRIIFRQNRAGINRRWFGMMKFRTMYLDAENKLADILERNSELKAEYESHHKIKDDPRLTRVGKFLRKYSLDELPQIFNVLKGDMSLIGPRTYLTWESDMVSSGYEELIFRIRPGISGLWQVTDRHTSSFEERKIIDLFYIRNWSMALDYYIFLRTIIVVLTGKGN
jgi:Undecaprenyl-phosphate galactose phosphotransferase WbaP